jgi:hypothetical protein
LVRFAVFPTVHLFRLNVVPGAPIERLVSRSPSRYLNSIIPIHSIVPIFSLQFSGFVWTFYACLFVCVQGREHTPVLTSAPSNKVAAGGCDTSGVNN